MALLNVENLIKQYPIKRSIFSRSFSYIRAVDGVSLTLQCRETLGVVGESGCGKTTLGYCILRLIEPTSGHVIFKGRNLLEMRGEELRRARAFLQIIFQDPYSSLNPRMSVNSIISEPIKTHLDITRSETCGRVAYMMEKVGLHPEHMNRYPHEFSGGQRQRIVIARALALNPLAVICDEPVSALDVSIQAQILNLLIQLQEEMNLSYIFIAHDLSVVEHISDRIAVMYLGRIVELAGHKAIYQNPQHPYTRALLSSIPVPDPDSQGSRIRLKGEMPSPLNPPLGCKFHTRCPDAAEVCIQGVPSLHDIGGQHWVACHHR